MSPFQIGINLPDKKWGYLALETTHFAFIEPDRATIDMCNSQEIWIAKLEGGPDPY